MQKKIYPLPTTSIYGITSGEGIPVICMHGITANAHIFEPIMDLLSDQFHVISIDQRGHGRSGRPPTYEGEDFAADIVALIEELNRGPVILLGHALGARNAFSAANRYPQHVRGVVAVDFTPFIEAEILEQLETRVISGNRRFADTEEIMAYLSQRYPLLPPEAIQRRADYGYRLADDGYRPLADDKAMVLTAAGLRQDLEEEVKQLSLPTILVRGASSKLVSEAAWEKTRQLRPDLEAVEISRVDHYVPEVDPFAVATVVRRML